MAMTNTLFSNRDLKILIFPLVIEQILSMLVGMVDTVMVSYAGEAAISGVALVDMINYLFITIFAAIATGGAVIVSQYLGDRQEKQANLAAGQLYTISAVVSTVIALLCFAFHKGILRLLYGSVEADVMGASITYFAITALSFPFLGIYNAAAALFRSMKKTNVTMYVSLLMNAINVVGNAVLIFGFRMGVEGVAIPTLVSRAVAAAVVLVLLYRPNLPLQVERVTWKHDPYVVKNILRFGVPNGLESSMFQLGKILLLSTVSVLGTAAVAANAVGNMVATFQCVPGLALGLAMVTVVSRCVGAGDYEKARFYTKKLLKYTYVTMGIAVAISLVCLPLILNLYNVSAEAEECAGQLVWLHGVLGVIFWPLSFTLPQALRAAGDTRFTMVSATVSMWTLRVGFGILLGRYWGFGVLGVWIAMCVDWLLRVALFLLRFHGHKWETMGLRE